MVKGGDRDNPNLPIVKRQELGERSDYNEFKDELRYDFFYACAYCTITETEAQGIGFEIDHYKPREKFHQDRNKYSNLMWSCEKCNGAKSDYFPSTEQQRKNYVVMRSDEEDPSAHYRVEDFQLKGIDNKGEFNIERLNLNRLMLRELRQIRAKMWEANGFIINGILEIQRIGIDALPGSQKAVFWRMRVSLLNDLAELADNTEESIRRMNKSPLLNGINDNNHEMKRRRYLKKIKALSTENTSLPLKGMVNKLNKR